MFNMYALIRPMYIRGDNYGGTHNGYVLIPEDHPLYGMDSDSIDEELPYSIHGGISFAKSHLEAKNVISESEVLTISDGVDKFGLNEDCYANKYWVVGFDTAHYGDNSTNWNKTAVTAETEKLFVMLQMLYT